MHSPKRTAPVPPFDEGGGAAACRRLAGRDNEARECQNITIRSEGNPVSYDGKTFTWNGKLLTKVTAADGSYTEFSYDANGIRTQKRQYTSGGTLEYDVDYVWQDGLLTHQSMTYYFHMTLNGTEKVVELPFTAKFVYDESNTPVGCLVNGEAALAFVRNLQGDVVAVVTQEGDVLAEYSYDPWGKVTVTYNGEEYEGMEAALMALYCPFAYRGYNYDFTTGLYYLQSRYYNPEWGRFLNVDDTNILLSTQGENLGANLFAYCNNNPVNKADYTGYWAEDVHSGYYVVTNKNGILMTNQPVVFRNGKSYPYGTYTWAMSAGFSMEYAKKIAEYCAEVDSKFSPFVLWYQSWHFNTSRVGETDSRLIIMTLLLIVAFASFDMAIKYDKNSYWYNQFLEEGLKYLGYALHPIQDYYAHTDDRVYSLPGGVKMHSPWNGTDSASERWGQVQKTERITMAILTSVYNIYPKLFMR